MKDPSHQDECHRLRIISDRKQRQRYYLGDIEDAGCCYYEALMSNANNLCLPDDMYLVK